MFTPFTHSCSLPVLLTLLSSLPLSSFVLCCCLPRLLCGYQTDINFVSCIALFHFDFDLYMSEDTKRDQNCSLHPLELEFHVVFNPSSLTGLGFTKEVNLLPGNSRDLPVSVSLALRLEICTVMLSTCLMCSGNWIQVLCFNLTILLTQPFPDFEVLPSS